MLREPAVIHTRPLPSAASCASARRAPAFPIGTTHTTAAMPIAMLNAVSAVRPLRCASARNACRTKAPPTTYERAPVERDGFSGTGRITTSLLRQRPAASYGPNSIPHSCDPGERIDHFLE
jgi:hypothetical protein